MRLTVIRKEYYKDTTIGKLYVNDKPYCWTLEDAVRGDNIKIPGYTAIPAGLYEGILSFSSRFQRTMPEILNVPMFTGIRIHGGNTHKNTDGCILIAENRPDTEVIQGTKEYDLVDILDHYDGEFILEVING